MPVETEQFIPVTILQPRTALLSPEIVFLQHGNGTSYNIVDYFNYVKGIDGKRMTLLSELAEGFYGANSDPRYASQLLRQNIRDVYRGKGEFTGDFPDYDAQTPAGRVIPDGYIGVLWRQLPENVEEKNGALHAEGGRTAFIDLPPDGWRVPDSEGRMSHEFSGTALATLPFEKRKEAERALERAGYSKDDLSRSWRGEKGYGTRAVRRAFWYDDHGPFDASADWSAGGRNPGLGARPASRLESLRSSGDAAENVVLVPVTEYEMLIQGRELTRDFISRARKLGIYLAHLYSEEYIHKVQ